MNVNNKYIINSNKYGLRTDCGPERIFSLKQTATQSRVREHIKKKKKAMLKFYLISTPESNNNR